MNYFEAIQRIVCYGEGFLPKEVAAKTRKREIVFTRQLIMYFMKEMTKDSLASIGRHFGKDHATVLHSHKTINNLIDTDRIVRDKVENYKQLIKERENFEKNILTDNIVELKERLLTSLAFNAPIDLGTIEIYNRLLVLLRVNNDQGPLVLPTIEDLERDVLSQISQRKIIDLTAILSYNRILSEPEIPAPT